MIVVTVAWVPLSLPVGQLVSQVVWDRHQEGVARDARIIVTLHALQDVKILQKRIHAPLVVAGVRLSVLEIVKIQQLPPDVVPAQQDVRQCVPVVALRLVRVVKVLVLELVQRLVQAGVPQVAWDLVKIIVNTPVKIVVSFHSFNSII